MTAASRVHEYFASLVAEDDLLLTEAALSLAQDAYPDLDLQGTLAGIDALVARLRRALPRDGDPWRKVQALNRFFFRELGFCCNRNDYYDPDNSYLNIVLRKRIGIPISLSVLYLEMAQQIDLPACGISFPGHFLLRIPLPGGDVVLDPTTGRSLSEARLIEMLEPYLTRSAESAAQTLRALLQPADAREIVARMLRNLKSIYLRAERWQRLLAVQQRLVILLPHALDERRDRGIAFARLDCVRPALEDLQCYLDARPDADDADAVEAQLAELRLRQADSSGDDGVA